MDLSSPPTQQPATSSGVNDINHPSELLFVVPVLPPISPFRLYLQRNLLPVPPSTTAVSISSILYEVDSLNISFIRGTNDVTSLPYESSMRVTNTGSTRIPLLIKEEYEPTIS